MRCSVVVFSARYKSRIPSPIHISLSYAWSPIDVSKKREIDTYTHIPGTIPTNISGNIENSVYLEAMSLIPARYKTPFTYFGIREYSNELLVL